MELVRSEAALPHPAGSLVFRASRLALTVAAIALTGVGVAYGWFVFGGAPWPFWIGFALYVLIVVPIYIFMCIRSFSRHNWLLRISPEGLAVRFHSWARGRAGGGAPEVLLLDWEEVEHAQRIDERMREQAGDSVRRWTRKEIELHLASGSGDEIGLALLENLKGTHDRSGRVRGGVRHHPVRWVEDGVIRLTLRGKNDFVRPGPAAVERALAQYVRVEPRLKIERGSTNDLDDAGFRATLYDLVDSGQTVQAVRLVRERRGCSLAEAKAEVDAAFGR